MKKIFFITFTFILLFTFPSKTIAQTPPPPTPTISTPSNGNASYNGGADANYVTWTNNEPPLVCYQVVPCNPADEPLCSVTNVLCHSSFTSVARSVNGTYGYVGDYANGTQTSMGIYDSNIYNSNTYYYIIKTCRNLRSPPGTVCGSAITTNSVPVPTLPPPIPASAQCDLSYGPMTINWTNISGENSYYVYRRRTTPKDPPNAQYIEWGISLPVDSTTTQDTNVNYQSSYEYYITGCKTNSGCGQSALTTSKTCPQPTPTPGFQINIKDPGGNNVTVGTLCGAACTSTSCTSGTVYSCAYWTNTNTFTKTTASYAYYGVQFPNQGQYQVTSTSANPATGTYAKSADGYFDYYTWSDANSKSGVNSVTFIVVTPTPIPAPCTVSSQSPQSGCYKDPPTFTGSYDNPADSIQFAVDNETAFASPWKCNTSGIWIDNTRPASYTCSSSDASTFTTGTYYWSAKSRDLATPVACTMPSTFSPSFPFDIDRTAPAVPAIPVASFNANAITFSWAASSDTGCLANATYADKYWIQQKWYKPFDAVNPWEWTVNNGEWSVPAPASPAYGPSSCSGRDAQTAYFKVIQAKDKYAIAGDVNSDNENPPYSTDLASSVAWTTYQCPTPTLYPTVAVSGLLKEYLGACSNNITSSTLSISVNPQYPTGVTSTCTYSPSSGTTHSSYSCNVNFDNQNYAVTPNQTLTLASTSDYYDNYWTQPNACPASTTPPEANKNNNISVDVSSPTSQKVFTQDIFFKNETAWFKIKDASFHNAGSTGFTNLIPYQRDPYDSDDVPDSTFSLGESGIVSASNTVNIGASATISSKGWKKDNYPRQSYLSSPLFQEYAKSRKGYQTITQADLSQITNHGIYLWGGASPLTLTSVPTSLNNFNVVLIVNGVVNINTSFNPTKSVAIFANTINFDASVTQATGLFIADTITTGTTTNQGLKIIGNLVATNPITNNRKWAVNSKPSLFVVTKADPYINLLPYLSTSAYDWTEIVK